MASAITSTHRAPAPLVPHWAVTVLRGSVVVLVLAAFVLVQMTSRSGVAWRLSTFTYQAGALAAVWYGWALLRPRAAPRPGLHGAVVLYVVVAGLVWNLFLTGMSMGYTTANVLLHVVLPVLVLTEWLAAANGPGRVRWWHPLAWLVYPAAYLGLALLVLNEAGRRAPYYFLDPDSVGGAAVAGNVLLLALAFAGLGYLLSGVGRAAAALRAQPRRIPPLTGTSRVNRVP